MNSRGRALPGRVLLLLLLAAAAPSRADYDPPIPTPAERAAVRKPGPARAEATASEAQQGLRALQNDVDITHYFLDLEFTPLGGNGTVSGSVTITAKSLVEDFRRLVLDLRENMVVSTVKRGLTHLDFAHAGDLLDIGLDRSFDAGESFVVQVTYAGQTLTNSGPIRWSKYANSAGPGQMVWTLSQPEGSRAWWPCKDRPDDKATVEEWWTVPNNWTATGNGVLIGIRDVGPNKQRFEWRPTRPLSTYLVSIAATDYVSFSDTYLRQAGGLMPVVYYVYAEDLADAQVSFGSTVDMLDFYARTFGEYPFVEDKYGMSAFPWGGAMEHSTNSSYGYGLIDGRNTHDWIIAHELAHQWWGDSLTPRDWRDIWLSEGFASHSEALWFESLNGPIGYRNYMNAQWREMFSGPLYDNPNLFSPTVYDKGAWVQHMLRGVMGDGAFFQALRDWYAEHKDSVVDSSMYRAHLEARYGATLDWFFDQWVYGVNSPRYEHGWTTAVLPNGTHRTFVRIRQVQTDAPAFRMPVQLTLVTDAGREVRTVWSDQVDQDFVLDTTEPLVDLIFDEHDWILKASSDEIELDDADLDGVPDRNDNCANMANAAQLDLDQDALGDACDDDDDGDTLVDGADCAALDPTAGAPDEVALLTVTTGPSRVTRLTWTAAARADVYDVSRGRLYALRAVGHYGTCLATRVPGLAFYHAAVPPPGEGFFYLIRGYDTGCGGGGPFGEDSSGDPRPSPCH